MRGMEPSRTHSTSQRGRLPATLVASGVIVGLGSMAWTWHGDCASNDALSWALIAAAVGLLVAAVWVARRSWPLCLATGLAGAVVLVAGNIAVSGIGDCIS